VYVGGILSLVGNSSAVGVVTYPFGLPTPTCEYNELPQQYTFSS
jgi:hypothetical protein